MSLDVSFNSSVDLTRMDMPLKELIVIGDRVLMRPDDAEEKTSVGLILPQTVRDKDEVMRGNIVKTGPGVPLADPNSISDEPWAASGQQNTRFLPMEARVGDHALFLRKAAVEIKYENEKYFIVPQAAILLLIRENEPGNDVSFDEKDDIDL